MYVSAEILHFFWLLLGMRYHLVEINVKILYEENVICVHLGVNREI